MKQTSTSQLFLLHAYGETTPEQNQCIAIQLCESAAARKEYMNMIKAKRMLNSKIKRPSATSVRIIMEYSRKTQTEHLQEM